MTVRLVGCLVLLASCRDTPRPPTEHERTREAHDVRGADARVVDAAPVAPVGAALRKACKSSFECGKGLLEPIDCMHSCVDRQCFLFVTVRAEGGACHGEKDGNEYQRVIEATSSATRLGFCDVSVGLYCDRGRCATRKPVGAPCRTSDYDRFECVVGTFCDAETGTCKPAPGVGGACDLDVSHRCAVSAYCEPSTMRCKPRRGDGARCDDGAACKSNFCDLDKQRCAAHPPQRACPF